MTISNLGKATERVNPLITAAIARLKDGIEPDQVFIEMCESAGRMPSEIWEFYEDIVALTIQCAAFTMMDLQLGSPPEWGLVKDTP